jgi:uncharacterized membrane protein
VARERSRAGWHALIPAIHFLHVFFAIMWLGSQFYTMFVLIPQIRKLPKEHGDALLANLRSGPARTITLVVATGTIVFGILRGLVGNALADPASAYGVTYLVSLAIGLAMLAWVWTRGFFGRGRSWMYNTGFAVMFVLMVAMRFGY